MNMDGRSFFNIVAEMRAAQKRYSNTRSQSALSDSKRFEAMVDREIERVNAIIERDKPKESTLFDGENAN